MQLNSNRSFIIKLLIPFAVVSFLAAVIISITLAINYDEQKDCIPSLIFFCVYTVVMVGAILFAKFYKGKRYEFSENEIVCYKRKKLLYSVNVADIQSISYYKFRFRYIFTIFMGELSEGGCWKLHVKIKDGTKRELGFFSIKDVRLLKEQLYGELLNVN